MVKELGGFDGRTPIGADSDLLMRLLLFYDIGNIQELLYSRKFHSDSLTKSKDYGHQSAIRLSYTDKMGQRILEMKPCYVAGDWKKLQAMAAEDMYIADSPFQLYESNCLTPVCYR